ncbi:MAG: outer membrane lipoprotein-sorting protein [Kiritimatiellia bacterium]
MWPRLIILAALLSASSSGASGEFSEPAPAPAALTADGVLEETIGRLPRELLQISGELRADPRDGKQGRRCQVQLSLDYGGQPPQARYTIMDAFGEELEQLTILRPEKGAVTWHYAKGYPLAEAPLPDPRAVIQGTDLSWSDLSLSFLWWRGGRIAGLEKVLDRECLVIETPAPAGEPTPYASARLWIDRQYRMLLRAEGCDAAGKPIRRIAVKSIKKIDTQWMVKDLDVTSLSSALRTSLRINIVDKPEMESPAR